MSVYIKQIDGGLVAPKDDATLHKIFNDQIGVIKGCGITYLSANQMRIAEGYLYIHGRMIEIEEETVLSPFAETDTEGEIILRIDLLAETPAVLQARVPKEVLTQEDINEGGTIFEYRLATYIINDTSVSDLVTVFETVSPGFSKDKILGSLSEVNAATIAGFLVDALAVKELRQEMSDNNKTMSEELEALNENFSTAADEIGDAITALGVSVPAGSSLADMATIIKNQLYKKAITQTLTGTVDMNYNSSAEEFTQQVNFSSSFEGIPTVTAAFVTVPSPAEEYSVSVESITRAGFILRLKGTFGNVATYTCNVKWTATYTRT